MITSLFTEVFSYCSLNIFVKIFAFECFEVFVVVIKIVTLFAIYRHQSVMFSLSSNNISSKSVKRFQILK